MQTSSSSSGFTLIEVLISSIILFLFIAMASQAFSQSAQSSLKAERAVKVAAVVPLLVETIHGQIQASKKAYNLAGQGELLGMQYLWKATLLQRKAPIDGFDPLLLEFKSYEERFNLFNVEVTVSLGSYQRHWQYEEISWFK